MAGEADLEVRGGRAGFPEQLYARLARVPGVALASPVLELDAGLWGRERTIRVIGLDILRAAQMQPQLVLEDRYELLAPDKVLLSAAAADALGLEEGGVLRLAVGQNRVELAVAGVLPASSLRGIAALTDIATAQWRLERLGDLNRIDLRISGDRERVSRQIQALLPPGVSVSRLDDLEDSAAYPSRAYRVNLNVLAMVALFTGGFLVFSAQALEVARRRGEHALLRVLGTTRARVACLVLAEAAALGALGSLAGLALLRVGQAAVLQGDTAAAIVYLNRLVDDFPGGGQIISPAAEIRDWRQVRLTCPGAAAERTGAGLRPRPQHPSTLRLGAKGLLAACACLSWRPVSGPQPR